MFANPQVTVARMFTDTASGIRPIDGIIFIAMQIIGALLAYAVYRLVFAKNTYRTEEK
jgi:glycerol uptake facilitator-like aquaporin